MASSERAFSDRVIEQGSLTLRTTPDDGTCRIELIGELDLSTVEALDQELRRAEREQPSTLVLDLSALDFIDSTGVGFLIETTSRCHEGGPRLTLVRGSADVDRIFRITGVHEHLPFSD